MVGAGEGVYATLEVPLQVAIYRRFICPIRLWSRDKHLQITRLEHRIILQDTQHHTAKLTFFLQHAHVLFARMLMTASVIELITVVYLYFPSSCITGFGRFKFSLQ